MRMRQRNSRFSTLTARYSA